MYQFSRKNGLRWTSQIDGFGGGGGGLGGAAGRGSTGRGAAIGTSGFGGSTGASSATGSASPVRARHSSEGIDFAQRSTKRSMVTGSSRFATRRSRTATMSGSASACREYQRYSIARGR